MASVAVRQNAWTGVTQRRHSSTPPGTSDVSETRAARWSGCSCRTAAVPDSKVRVVSFPATSSVRRNMNSSSLLSGHPPTSLPTRSETRSSPGRSRFDRMCATMNPESSPSAAIVSSGGRSGDSMAASDQPRKSSRSDSSIPSSSAITASGKGAASSATKSISSRGSTASSSVEALARMESVRPAMARGVNRRLTSPRKAACWGGSMCRIERPSIGASLARSGSLTNAPRPEQKWPGSRLRFRMSS